MVVVAPISTSGPGTTKLRYPGLRPFEDTELDRDLFFGRDVDEQTVLHQILGQDLFVLFAGSGTGKTSLLKAGVMHELRDRDMWPVLIRLDDATRPPFETVREALATANGEHEIEVLGSDREVDDLWDLIAGVEVWRSNVLQMPVLIFDQFEELFSFQAPAERSAFVADIANIVRRTPPLRSEADGDSMQLPPPRAKIVLSIREDRLAELEAFAGQLPQILTHRYQLRPLTCSQAERAIREPAEIDDDRIESVRFAYSDEAVALITDFLSNESIDDGADAVEPFQLQIVCNHVETRILPRKLESSNEQGATEPEPSGVGDPDSGRDTVVITPADLDEGADLGKILTEFYTRQVESFPSKRDRRRIRDLCETRLISSRGRRIMLAKDEIHSVSGVSEVQLEKLEDQRLIRAEPRRGSTYYELAHDTLIQPVLEARRQRQEEERRRNRVLAIVGLCIAAVGFGALFVLAVTGGDDEPAELEIGGEAWPGTVAQGGDPEEIEFAGTANQAVSLTMSSDASLTLQLFGPAGEEPIASTSEARPDATVGLTEVLPSTGTYRVVVSRGPEVDESSGDYSVSSRWVETDCDRPETDECAIVLKVDDEFGPLPGIIGQREIDPFVIVGEKGQLVTLTMEPTSDDFDGVLKIFDTSGVAASELGDHELDSRKAGGPGEPDVISAQLPVDGSYPVLARGAFNTASSIQDVGGYSVSARSTNVVAGPETPGRIDGEGRWTALAFDGVEDQAVYLTLTMEDTDGEIQVLDPEGAQIGVRTGSQTVVIPTETGPHRVWVTAPNAGAFVLTVEESDLLGEAPSTAVDVFTFEGAAGEVVFITFTLPSDVTATGELVAPTSERLQVAEVHGGAPPMTVVLPVSGTYRLLARDFTGSPTDYEVRLERLTPSSVDPIERGDPPTEGLIGRPDEVDVHRIVWEPGDAITLTLRSEALDGVLAVYSASGTELGFSDFGGGEGATERIATVLPDDGIAWVLIGSDRGSTGGYVLELADAVPRGEVDDNASKSSQIGRTEDDVYTFEAEAGQAVTLRLESVELDGVLEVYGPAGDEIALIDSGGTGSTETVTVIATDNGTHWVVVRGAGSSAGVYRLFLQRSEVVAVEVG